MIWYAIVGQHCHTDQQKWSKNKHYKVQALVFKTEHKGDNNGSVKFLGVHRDSRL